jgi:hypothetical protein
MHVVSFFINQDVGNYDKTITSLRSKHPELPDPRDDEFGIRLTEKGRRYIKYSLGVGLMETPFFLAAHVFASQSDSYDADGWSLPYCLAIACSGIFYIVIGFFFLFRVLETYFSKRISVLVVIAIAFATNLFYQGTFVTMAHGFLFFDYCLLLYFTMRFRQAPSTLKAFGIGATVGLITLTRVPEVISVLIPLLWGVTGWRSLKNRILGAIKYKQFLIVGATGFVLLFAIQFCYWHYVSGQLVFNPYSGEGFNFLRPQILNGWFHFANGWLIYTPIMLLGLAGLIFLFRLHKGLPLCIIVFVGLQAFIHYSYYAWTYFPGFGSRPMVETYPLMALGLAAFFAFCHQRKWLTWIPLMIVILLSGLNLFQTWQVQRGLFYSERGSKAFYLEMFGKTEPTLNALRAYDSHELQPDESRVALDRILVIRDFEDSTEYNVSKEIWLSGEQALYDSREYLNLIEDLSLQGMEPRNWLRLEISAFIRDEDRLHQRDQCAELVLELYDGKHRRREWVGTKISSYVGNTGHSIWSTGEVNMWDDASVYVRLPRAFKSDWTANVFVWNPHGQKMYLDDFQMAYYHQN